MPRVVPKSPQDDLLTIDEAAELASVSVYKLWDEIRVGLLKTHPVPKEPGSLAVTHKVSRAALERWARAFGPGALAGNDPHGFEVASMCEVRGCYAYAPGERCTSHGRGDLVPLPRPLTHSETTSYHEAGHVEVARTLGLKVLRASVVADYGPDGSAGRFEWEKAPDTPDGIRADAAVSLAGDIADTMARRQDWRTLSFRGTLQREQHGLDIARVCRALRVGDDARATATASDWLDNEIPGAAELAHTILECGWSNVVYTAMRLRQRGTISYVGNPQAKPEKETT